MKTDAPVHTPILEIRNLDIEYLTEDAPVKAVKDVSLTVLAGQFHGLVGESGSGKSTVAMSILRILQAPGLITNGQVLLGGVDTLTLRPSELRKLRWSRASIVMQNSLTALDPVQRVGRQIREVLKTHNQDFSNTKVRNLLDMVGVPPSRISSYPHELSGGMRQRVAIAMALALQPLLLIMDEPTTALDVLVQEMIIDTIRDLQKELGFGVLFITHDLPLLLKHGDTVTVMKGGQVMESASVDDIKSGRIENKYTRTLVSSLPTRIWNNERN